MAAAQRSALEIDGLVETLASACDDAGMNDTLQKLLSLPDQTRRNAVTFLLDQMEKTGAPIELCEAFSCMLDDEIAERAYEVIFKCQRPNSAG